MPLSPLSTHHTSPSVSCILSVYRFSKVTTAHSTSQCSSVDALTDATIRDEYETISRLNTVIGTDLLKRVATQDGQELETALQLQLMRYLMKGCSHHSCTLKSNDMTLMPRVTELHLPGTNAWEPFDDFIQEMLAL